MNTGPGRNRPVESAIDEVLAAEKNALTEIADCERQAEEILGAARQSVRAVIRCTQERLARLHANCADKTRERIAEIERDANAYDACTVPGDGELAVLERAVRAVAAELTTRGSGDGD